MARFNIALLPDTSVQRVLGDFARSHFGNIQQGYILGPNAHAHVTLCQFRADNEDLAKNAFSSWGCDAPMELSLGEFQLRKGTKEHLGMLWAEFLIVRDSSLIRLQEHCFKHLNSSFEVLTPIETYSPHITLARISSTAPKEMFVDHPPCEAVFTCTPAVGLSTENGFFLAELCTKAQGPDACRAVGGGAVNDVQQR